MSVPRRAVLFVIALAIALFVSVLYQWKFSGVTTAIAVQREPLPPPSPPPPHQRQPLAPYPAKCFVDAMDVPEVAASTYPPELPVVAESSYGVAPADLFNPLQPYPPRMHHPLVRLFRQYSGPVERDWMTDWLGVRTFFQHECSTRQSFQYVDYVPSRRYQCLRHCQLVNSGQLEASGEMPLFDDEYPEWVDLLASVVRTPLNRHYVVFELGARIGTWGVRALAARRQLMGGTLANATFLGLESEAKYVSWMRYHVRANGMEPYSVLVHGAAKRRAAAAYSLSELMAQAKVDHVDLLDLDVQGAESGFFARSNVLQQLNESVVHVHVGTHSASIHKELRAIFLDRLKWREVLNLPHSGTAHDSTLRDSLQTNAAAWTRTNYGPVNVRDGMLGYVNPRFVPAQEPLYEPITLIV